MKQHTEQFLRIIEGHRGIIYKIADAYSQTTQDRQDLIQDIILQIWSSFERYDAAYKYSTWIYRIALNTALSFVRKSKLIVYTDLPEACLTTDDVGGEDKEGRLRDLHRLIQNLGDVEKAIMLLILDGLNHQDIATITGLSPTNVSTRIHRAKNKLKQQFNQLKSSDHGK